MCEEPTQAETFTVELNGHTGTCTVSGGEAPSVTVKCKYGTKTAQLGGRSARELARGLLFEMLPTVT